MGFYMQDDMWEAVSELPKRQQDEVMGALVRLAYTGEPTELSGAPRVAFIAFRDRVLLSVERSRNGKLGGRQNGSKPASKTEANAKQKAKQTPSKPASKTEAKPEPPIKEGEREREELPSGSSRGGGRFCAPTPAAVKAYAEEYAASKGIKSAFDAERFCDYYASRGWKVGNAAMKDWQAAVRNWMRRDSVEGGKDDGNADDPYLNAW